MQVYVSRQISLPAEDLWRHLSDFSGVARFHPFVETADQLSASNEGVGARRKCNFYDGKSVVERVIEWEPGRRLKVELSEMNLPVKWALAEMSLSSINDHETEASISMVFQPKFGLLGALMGVLMMKPMMRKIFSQVLHGLEHHARTGEVIGKGGAPVVKDGLAPA
jgi:uncharacterized protein YndB with AHSA1/START domain|tara:strand:+ start:191 stop:688 length:498 start_codon:yes stop_codon:yes gene_type:complete